MDADSDIDLHHGQGTQEIVWRINDEANRAGNSSPLKSNTPRASPAKTNGTTSPPKKSTVALNRKRKRPLKMLYASLHDVLSYRALRRYSIVNLDSIPENINIIACEDGDSRMVADASVRLSGAHGQYISNIHLVRGIAK